MKKKLDIKTLINNIIYPTDNRLSISEFSTKLMPDVYSSFVYEITEFPCFRSLDDRSQTLCEDEGRSDG